MISGADEGLGEGFPDVACGTDDENVWHFGWVIMQYDFEKGEFSEKLKLLTM